MGALDTAPGGVMRQVLKRARAGGGGGVRGEREREKRPSNRLAAGKETY
jgi:hypothetical protein